MKTELFKKNCKWFILISFVLMIVINILANAIPINGITTGEVSDKYPILIKPASYAFIIWSLIYLLLAGFVIYSFIRPKYSQPICTKFVLSCILNSLWIVFWHYEQLFISAIIIFLLAVTVFEIYLITQDYDVDNLIIPNLVLKQSFSIYAAWLTIAVFQNFSILIYSYGFLLSIETIVAIIILLMITAFGAVVTYKNNDITFGLVYIWAIIAIAVEQTQTPIISITSTLSVVFLIIWLIRLVIKNKI